MPQSFVCLHVHLVFSTKNRDPMITEDLALRLYDYIGGIIRNVDGTLIAAVRHSRTYGTYETQERLTSIRKTLAKPVAPGEADHNTLRR